MQLTNENRFFEKKNFLHKKYKKIFLLILRFFFHVKNNFKGNFKKKKLDKMP